VKSPVKSKRLGCGEGETIVLLGYQASLACPAGKSGVKAKTLGRLEAVARDRGRGILFLF
jgi:hypothetical protein